MDGRTDPGHDAEATLVQGSLNSNSAFLGKGDLGNSWLEYDRAKAAVNEWMFERYKQSQP
jgi:hypothetical protein